MPLRLDVKVSLLWQLKLVLKVLKLFYNVYLFLLMPLLLVPIEKAGFSFRPCQVYGLAFKGTMDVSITV